MKYGELDARLAALRFHRVVYVTRRVPTEIPAALERILVSQARNPRNPSNRFILRRRPPGKHYGS